MAGADEVAQQRPPVLRVSIGDLRAVLGEQRQILQYLGVLACNGADIHYSDRMEEIAHRAVRVEALAGFLAGLLPYEAELLALARHNPLPPEIWRSYRLTGLNDAYLEGRSVLLRTVCVRDMGAECEFETDGQQRVRLRSAPRSAVVAIADSR